VDRRLRELLERAESRPESLTFAELKRLCEAIFGNGRQTGGSHLIFRTGVREMPIVNIQPRGKMAKTYQCRQVARAIRALQRK